MTITTDSNVKKFYWIQAANLMTKDKAVQNATSYAISYPNQDMILLEAVGIVKKSKPAIVDLPIIEV